MSILNSDQEAFARRVANACGLSFQAVAAWCLCEEPASRDASAQGHNWLNLLHQTTGQRVGYSGVPIAGWSPAGFAQFSSLDDAIRETVFWVMKMSNYAGIRASRGKPPLDQVEAIAASPWNAGHYGDGHTIRQVLVDTVLKAYPLAPPPSHRHARYRVDWTSRAGDPQQSLTRHLGRWLTRHWPAVVGKRVRQITRL